jgi:hypothetical protein
LEYRSTRSRLAKAAFQKLFEDKKRNETPEQFTIEQVRPSESPSTHSTHRAPLPVSDERTCACRIPRPASRDYSTPCACCAVLLESVGASAELCTTHVAAADPCFEGSPSCQGVTLIESKRPLASNARCCTPAKSTPATSAPGLGLSPLLGFGVQMALLSLCSAPRRT